MLESSNHNDNLTFHVIYEITVYMGNFPPLYNHCLLKHIIMDKIYANAKICKTAINVQNPR